MSMRTRAERGARSQRPAWPLEISRGGFIRFARSLSSPGVPSHSPILSFLHAEHEVRVVLRGDGPVVVNGPVAPTAALLGLLPVGRAAHEIDTAGKDPHMATLFVAKSQPPRPASAGY